MSGHVRMRRSLTVARVIRWTVLLAIAGLAFVGSSSGSARTSALLPPEVTISLDPLGPQLPRINKDISLVANASDPNGGTITAYSWDFNNDGVPDSTAQNPTISGGFATPGDHKVKVTVTSSESLTASSWFLVHVHSGNLPPVVTLISTNQQNPRSGTPVDFSSDANDPDGDNTKLTYDWNFGDGTPHSTDPEPTHAFTTADPIHNFLVTLTVTDQDGGQATQTAIVPVHGPNEPPAILSVSSGVTTAAPGQDVSISALVTDDATALGSLSYSWNFGDGSPASTSSSPMHSWAAPGFYTVTVTIGDGDGGSSVASFVQAVGQPTTRPFAFFFTDYDVAFLFDTGPGPVRPGTAMSFYDLSSAQGTATITGRSWHWGDGTADGSGAQPTHTFSAVGTYTVVETVTDSNGKQDEYGETVTVSTEQLPPNVSINASLQTPRTNQEVGFTSTVVDADNPPIQSDPTNVHVTYHWDFGDGQTSTDANPSHAYATAGAKTVVLTVTDTDDNFSTQASEVVLVHSGDLPPTTSLAAFPSQPGTGEVVNFTNDTFDVDDPTGPLTYVWDFGDGSPTSTLASPTHVYSAPGDYFVTLTATDPSNVSATEGITVQVLLDKAPTLEINPEITGTAQAGQTLTEHDGIFDGSPATHTYQWQDCDAGGVNCSPIAGATSSAYLLTAADVGHTIRVTDTATNNGGSASGTSQPTLVVVVAPPAVNTGPSISGMTTVGQLLTANPGSWSGSPSFAYQWERCDGGGSACTDIPGATTSTYTLTAADQGHTLRVRITATNGGGSVPATSGPTGVVAGIVTPPVRTADPTITGTARIGQVLTEHDGTFSGSPATHTYQWQQCDSNGANCVAISGATSSTYTVTSADVGHTLRVVDTATNTAGSASGTSGATAVVVTLPPTVTTSPSISGTTKVGQTLTANAGIWTGSPTFTYQWESCDASGASCTDIAGATAPTYTLAAADQGRTIRVRVTGANTGGSLDSTSAQTATVAAASGGGGGGGGLTSAQIKARIVGQLAPKGAAASIEQLLAKGYYNLTFTAPTGGSATIAWYFLPSGARLLAAAGNAAPKPVLVASGKHSFSKAGKATIKLTLTGAAKSLLRKHSSLKITGKVTFKPSGKATVTATKAFTLKK